MRDAARVPRPPINPPTGHQMRQQGLAQNYQICQFWAKFGRAWAKILIINVIAIFVNGAYHKYTQGYNFPIRTTPKKISVSELGVIFRGSPLFLAVSGHSHFRGISALNFGPFSTKLGGTVRAIENDPEGQRTRSGPELRRNGPFLHSAEKWFLA